MYSVNRRLIRGDMIEVYKLFVGLVDIDYRKFFTLETNGRTRGHDKKIKKMACKLDVRKYSFSQRVVDFWNGLPGEVVNSTSLGSFKKNLDKYMEKEGFW